jgi:hypothetical protein
VPSPTTPGQANKVLVPTRGFFQGLRKFTYPVCLFFFTVREEQAFFTWLAELTVREEQAFFTWLAEPVVNGDGPKLVHHTQAHC